MSGAAKIKLHRIILAEGRNCRLTSLTCWPLLLLVRLYPIGPLDHQYQQADEISWQTGSNA